MEIKITKREKLYEMNNEMCHNFYYLVHGRLYNDDKTAYRKFKFVSWFDIFDVDEFFYDNEEMNNIITEDMIKEYLEECIWGTVSIVTDYNNENQLRNFYDMCNDSIIRYNEVSKHW